jgi:hypothetical protein
MLGSELIGKMRSRLRDEAKEGWSDPELLDSVNFALVAVAGKLLPWKGRWVSDTITGVDTYSVPDDFMAPISLYVDGKVVEIKGIEWALSHDSETPVAFIDMGSLILYPVPTQAQPIVFNYHANRKIAEVSDDLNISAEMEDTVLYYALSLAHQKQANEESLTQSQYYLKLYRERCGDIAKITTQRRSSRSSKSTYQRF